MKVVELDPFTNKYIVPIRAENICLLKQEFLGVLNLPLISKLMGCKQLLAPIDYVLEAIGPDGSSIIVEPLSKQLLIKRLVARTPLTLPTRTSKWIPPRIYIHDIIKYMEHMNLVGSEGETIVNPLPSPIEILFDEEIIRAIEGGAILFDKTVRERNISLLEIEEVREQDGNITYSKDDFTIIFGKAGKVSAKILEFQKNTSLIINSGTDKLVVSDNNVYVKTDKLIIEHNYYNTHIRYLQPLGFIDEYVDRATITSPALCIEPVSKYSLCLLSKEPITLEYYPGKIFVNIRGFANIIFSRKMFEWNNTLNMLWSLINEPFKIKGRLKTILWRITPYTVKPLLFKVTKSSDRRITTVLMIWNSNNKLVQAEIWFPGKITHARTLDLKYNVVEELVPDYDRIRIGVPALGIMLIEIEILRLPPLLLKELMRRNILSPYTPP